jgi:hypothetical protein
MFSTFFPGPLGTGHEPRGADCPAGDRAETNKRRTLRGETVSRDHRVGIVARRNTAGCDLMKSAQWADAFVSAVVQFWVLSGA